MAPSSGAERCERWAENAWRHGLRSVKAKGDRASSRGDATGCCRGCRAALAGRGASPSVLERQAHVGQQVLDRFDESGDRMTIGRRSQILSGHVKIDLRAGDEPMAEQVADRDEAHAGTNEVRCE